ncbi:MAG: hypothetical protein KDA41_19190, partial [Planctomycetales bacterium]|nr:hypothetical protein [Planctomycetales bacterium]
MPDLIAQGAQSNDRWRRSIPSRQNVVLGRTAAWAVPWDRQISRQHAELHWKHGRLQVRRLPDTRNPIFLLGKPSDHFFVKPGEQFVIGGTSFLVADEKVHVNADSPQPVTEQSFSPQFLQGLRFRNADQRIDVLSRL